MRYLCFEDVLDDVGDIFWAKKSPNSVYLNWIPSIQNKVYQQTAGAVQELRKATDQRNMLRNKYFKKKGDHHRRQMYVRWGK